MSMVHDIRHALTDTLAPEIRELKARLDALDTRMGHLEACFDRNEAAADRRHSQVLNTIRDAMEITHLCERIARLEAEREPESQHHA